ncbi:MAG TPA: threonine/serine dehydratase [Thermoanaerobaculia bacterium]|nr:threonine/serine dehydratase [Thermoanaerobaculia bacterium]
MSEPSLPLADIEAARLRLGDLVRETPVWHWRGREIDGLVGASTEVILKLELFQVAGTFKARGALLNLLALPEASRARGVTAVSAGNHAMAVAFAAGRLGTTAKVVMPRTANPARVEGCRALGAEVVLVDDVGFAFDEVRRIEREEGRAFIHPFDGRETLLGTATLGLELGRQAPGLDAVIVPIGGGGLAAGAAAALRQLQPSCRVFGVEPAGAAVMSASFAAGEAQRMEKLTTIADSLAAPHTTPGTYAACRRYLEDVVTIEDDAMRWAMGLIQREMKLAVEPAGAAATAALLGPLRETLRGRRVGLIVCGTNIDAATWCRLAATP